MSYDVFLDQEKVVMGRKLWYSQNSSVVHGDTTIHTPEDVQRELLEKGKRDQVM